MTVGKLFPSGAYCITDIIKGELVTRKYMGFTKKDAVQMFKREMKLTTTKEESNHA